MNTMNAKGIRLAFLFLYASLLLWGQQSTPATEFNKVFEKTFYSSILDEKRLLYIHIPGKKVNYPVLYLLDGQSIELYREALSITLMSEKVGPHIIVGIVTSGTRNRDMIPVEVSDRPGSGGAAQFLAFIAEELQPYMDKKFKTSGTNILYGGSNAGLFTVYTMLESPESFLGFISSSTMIGHCQEFMVEKAKNMDPRRLEGKFLYIHYGMNGEYDRVLNYIPGYYKLLTDRFGGNLTSGFRAEKNGGHVPYGGIANGLDFIYKP